MWQSFEKRNQTVSEGNKKHPVPNAEPALRGILLRCRFTKAHQSGR
jgi:hypothetical protein